MKIAEPEYHTAKIRLFNPVDGDRKVESKYGGTYLTETGVLAAFIVELMERVEVLENQVGGLK